MILAFYLFWLTWAAWCSLSPTNLCRIDQVSEGKYCHWQCHFLFGDKRCASNSDIDLTCFSYLEWCDKNRTDHICVTVTRVAKVRTATFAVTDIGGEGVGSFAFNYEFLYLPWLTLLMQHKFNMSYLCHVDQGSQGKNSHCCCQRHKTMLHATVTLSVLVFATWGDVTQFW